MDSIIKNELRNSLRGEFKLFKRSIPVEGDQGMEYLKQILIPNLIEDFEGTIKYINSISDDKESVIDEMVRNQIGSGLCFYTYVKYDIFMVNIWDDLMTIFKDFKLMEFDFENKISDIVDKNFDISVDSIICGLEKRLEFLMIIDKFINNKE